MTFESNLATAIAQFESALAAYSPERMPPELIEKWRNLKGGESSVGATITYTSSLATASSSVNAGAKSVEIYCLSGSGTVLTSIAISASGKISGWKAEAQGNDTLAAIPYTVAASSQFLIIEGR